MVGGVAVRDGGEVVATGVDFEGCFCENRGFFFFLFFFSSFPFLLSLSFPLTLLPFQRRVKS